MSGARNKNHNTASPDGIHDIATPAKKEVQDHHSISRPPTVPVSVGGCFQSEINSALLQEAEQIKSESRAT